MPFRLTILGTNSAAPTSARMSSAQLLDTGKHHFLLDCAEGTQIQLRRLKIRFQKIDHIFITHLHGDHFFGLVGLMTTYHLLGRSRPLHIYSVPELKEAIDIQLKVSNTTLIYPVEYHGIDPHIHSVIYEDKSIVISTLPLLHRIPTCGFLFREKDGPRKINKEAISNIEVPLEAFNYFQHGKDYVAEDGKVLRYGDFTSEPRQGVSYAYCTDTGYHEPLIPFIRNISCLFHESTFLHTEASLAKEKQHATAGQAASIAKEANVNMLILGHFSSRYKNLEDFLTEAREIFENTALAEEGKTFIINNSP